MDDNLVVMPARRVYLTYISALYIFMLRLLGSLASLHCIGSYFLFIIAQNAFVWSIFLFSHISIFSK